MIYQRDYIQSRQVTRRHYTSAQLGTFVNEYSGTGIRGGGTNIGRKSLRAPRWHIQCLLPPPHRFFSNRFLSYTPFTLPPELKNQKPHLAAIAMVPPLKGH